jgi:hypothetical protein
MFKEADDGHVKTTLSKYEGMYSRKESFEVWWFQTQEKNKQSLYLQTMNRRDVFRV